MSELTQEQLEHYRERLLTIMETVEAALSQAAGEGQVDTSGGTIGRLSRMDAIQVQAMAQMGHAQLEIRLKRVQAALIALDAGRYGLCRECGYPIGRGRLEALPEAPFCVDCQEGFES